METMVEMVEMVELVEMSDNEMAEVSGAFWFSSISSGFSYNSKCDTKPAPVPTDPKDGGGSDPKGDPKGDPKDDPKPAPPPVVCKPVVSFSWFGFGKCW